MWLSNRSDAFASTAHTMAGVAALTVMAASLCTLFGAPTILNAADSSSGVVSPVSAKISSVASSSTHGAQRAAQSGPGFAESAAATSGIEKNLLLNGDLRTGSSSSPDHWRSEGWEQKPGMTTFQWIHRGSAPGELKVTNHKPNDARWVQSLTLPPGWFYFSARIRAEDVSSGGQGASLSILEGAIGTVDLHGTTDWQRRGFYLKVGPKGADVEVACRLGGFGMLNTGTAMCTDLKVTPTAAPPGAADPVFDLDQVRRQYATPPIGRPWTLAAAFAFTVGLALLGWTVLSKASLADPAQPNPDHPLRGKTRWSGEP
jgi:hypothetical protein